MAPGDCHRVSVDAEGHAPDVVLEIKIVNFINEFLFTQTEDCTHVVVPRHRANRHKRYRGMWRSAVRSLLKKYNDRGLNQAQGADMARAPRKGSHKAMTLAARNTDSDSKAINCVPDTGNGENLIIDVVSQEGNERCCADEGFLTASTVSKARRKPEPCPYITQHPSANSNYLSLGSFAAQKKHGTCSFCFRTLEEQAMARCPQVSLMETGRDPLHSGIQMREIMPAKAAHATATPSRKKPPRPPRSHSLSNLSQTSLVKTARRARPFNIGLKRKKLPALGANASSLWAWVVTLCFAAIIVIQAFGGHTTFREAFPKAAAGGEARTSQAIHGDSLKVSPDLEISPPNLGRSIEGPFFQHRAGSIPNFVDQVQQSQLEVPQSGYAESSGKEAQAMTRLHDLQDTNILILQA